jgi:hypothetical protein
MTLPKSPYERMAKKCRWSALEFEMSAAASLARVVALADTCAALSAEIDDLLIQAMDTSGRPIIDRDPTESRVWLVSGLRHNLLNHRKAYQAELVTLENLRRQLLAAKSRRDEFQRKHSDALASQRHVADQRILEDLSETFIASLAARNSTNVSDLQMRN